MESAVPRPLPGSLGGRVPPLYVVLLFLGTGLSAFEAGRNLHDTQLPADTPLQSLQHGLAFAACLLLILLAHEMGHFVAARRHGIDASWPVFLPAPFLSPVGTFGAVIRLRALPQTRRALLELGASGPLAGFAVAVPILAAGLRLSTPVPAETFGPVWTLAGALRQYLAVGLWPQPREAFILGEPLILRALAALVGAPLQAGQTLAWHPVALAGWFGLLVTALNLVPLGQLDGGRILYACSPRAHRLLAVPLAAGLVALGLVGGFAAWALLGLAGGLFLRKHPPLPAPPPARLSGREKALLLAAAVVFAVSFVPVPLAALSG